MIAWSTEKKSAHGSLKAGTSVFAESSDQASGVDTGAPRFARGE